MTSNRATYFCPRKLFWAKSQKSVLRSALDPWTRCHRRKKAPPVIAIVMTASSTMTAKIMACLMTGQMAPRHQCALMQTGFHRISRTAALGLVVLARTQVSHIPVFVCLVVCFYVCVQVQDRCVCLCARKNTSDSCVCVRVCVRLRVRGGCVSGSIRVFICPQEVQ